MNAYEAQTPEGKRSNRFSAPYELDGLTSDDNDGTRTPTGSRRSRISRHLGARGASETPTQPRSLALKLQNTGSTGEQTSKNDVSSPFVN